MRATNRFSYNDSVTPLWIGIQAHVPFLCFASPGRHGQAEWADQRYQFWNTGSSHDLLAKFQSAWSCRHSCTPVCTSHSLAIPRIIHGSAKRPSSSLPGLRSQICKYRNKCFRKLKQSYKHGIQTCHASSTGSFLDAKEHKTPQWLPNCKLSVVMEMPVIIIPQTGAPSQKTVLIVFWFSAPWLWSAQANQERSVQVNLRHALPKCRMSQIRLGITTTQGCEKILRFFHLRFFPLSHFCSWIDCDASPSICSTAHWLVSRGRRKAL